VAILPEQDKQYDEEHYRDRIQRKHPETKEFIDRLLREKKILHMLESI
jgi:hypothetical protein